MPSGLPKDEYNAYMRDYVLNRYRRRRQEAIEFLGGCCAECGESEGLEIDHIDRRQKTFNFGKAIAGFSEERLKAELAKAQLLCYSCHTIKSIRERGHTPRKERYERPDRQITASVV